MFVELEVIEGTLKQSFIETEIQLCFEKNIYSNIKAGLD